MIRAARALARPIACALFALCATPTTPGADPPENIQLIAALPPSTESVLVWRYGALTSAESVLREESLRMIDSLGQQPNPQMRDRPEDVVLRYVAMATPLVSAQAGSGFTAPEGIGVGNYNGRSIWFVEKPLTALIKRLLERKDIQGELTSLRLGDVQAFETPIELRTTLEKAVKPIREKRFIAFPSEHCVVITESRDELEFIVASLGAKSPEMPKQWKPFAVGLDIEAPVLLLRRYDPKNEQDFYSPVNPRKPDFKRVDIEGFGLVLPSTRHLSFQMKCVTTQPERAAAFYQADALRKDLFAWEIHPQPGAFSAQISPKDEKSERSCASLVVLYLHILFGPNLFI